MLGAALTHEKSEPLYYRYSWLHLTRPMTWGGSLIPGLLGTALAERFGQVHLGYLLVFLVAALLVQSAANMFNDYFDVLHGQDLENWSSERSRETHPSHHAIWLGSWLTVTAAVVLGVWLTMHTDWYVGLLGVLSIAAGYFYSGGPKPLSALGLGELTAAVFMGPVIVAIAYVIQRGTLSDSILFTAVPSSLLIASMILTNNIRDIEKDRGFRRTIPLRVGRRSAVGVLTTLLVLSYVSIGLSVILNFVRPLALLALIALPLAVLLRYKLRNNAKTSEIASAMKLSAPHYLSFGLLFIAGIWL